MYKTTAEQLKPLNRTEVGLGHFAFGDFHEVNGKAEYVPYTTAHFWNTRRQIKVGDAVIPSKPYTDTRVFVNDKGHVHHPIKKLTQKQKRKYIMLARGYVGGKLNFPVGVYSIF